MNLEQIKKMAAEGIEERISQIKKEAEAEGADLDALLSEIDALEERKKELEKAHAAKEEIRKRVANGSGVVKKEFNEAEKEVNEEEKRAQKFVETGHISKRALLATGQIAKPTKVGGINDLPEIASGIVDDVSAVPLEGYGTYEVAYKKTDATAADHTDGQAVGGTGATFDTVKINPVEWGVLDTVSKLIKKLSPLAYLEKVEAAALIALRATASRKIVAAIKASALVENKTSVALDENYLRSLLLGFRAIPGKGEVKLYLSQSDLSALGKVRGTNEKKAVYEIEFDAGTTLSGTIKDGGSAARFRVVDGLEAGMQLFGQPGTVEMPMWGDYEISTDEGGQYFASNLIAVKGLQTANADLTTWHGMQVIKQGEA